MNLLAAGGWAGSTEQARSTARMRPIRRLLYSADGGFDFRLVFGPVFGGFCFEAHDQDGLGVGGSDQAPAIFEEDARAIHIHDGADLLEVFGDLGDDGELLIVGAIDPEFGSGDYFLEAGELG